VKPSTAQGANASNTQENGKVAVHDCDSVGGSSGNRKERDGVGMSNKEPEISRIPDISKAPDSSYMRRQTEEVQVNRQPVGFDARLAAAVASRALGQQEETFGGSDSDSESSSSSSSESADF